MNPNIRTFVPARTIGQNRVPYSHIPPHELSTRGWSSMPKSHSESLVLSLPAPRRGDRRFYPSLSRIAELRYKPSLVYIGDDFAALSPQGQYYGIFSLYTDEDILSGLSWEALSKLMVALHQHEVYVEISLAEGPLLVTESIRLKGDAAFVVGLAAKGNPSDAKHTRAINRLLAAGLCHLAPQLKEYMNTQEPLRQYFTFFDQNRLPGLAAQVVLRTRQDPEGEHTRSLCTLMDLFESNFDAHLKRLKKQKLDRSELEKNAKALADAVQKSVKDLATYLYNNRPRLLTREAAFRMLAIGDSLVLAAFYQTCAKLQNKDARDKALIHDIANMTIGTTLKAGIGLALYGSDGGGLVDSLIYGLVDSLVPVRNLPGNTQLLVRDYVREIEGYAGRLSGLQGSINERRRYTQQAQDLRWYAQELLSTWAIPSLRLDRVGEGCRACETAHDWAELNNQRDGGVYVSFVNFFRRH